MQEGEEAKVHLVGAPVADDDVLTEDMARARLLEDVKKIADKAASTKKPTEQG